LFQYEKLVLNKGLKIEKKEFTTEGRKIPLTEIRDKMLQKQEPYLRKRTDEQYNALKEDELKKRLQELHELESNKDLNVDEMREKLKDIERNRSLLVWLDNSTVANHGYLVCMVTCLYDPAVFFTSQEYKADTGKDVNIQKVIEQPEMHFVARSGSSNDEQMLYTDTRLQCIRELDRSISINSIPYYDVMRFCHGDSPQRACEAGQQKGGYYFCSTCGIHSVMANDIDHALNCRIESLQTKKDAIMHGAVARRNSLFFKLKPLKGLTKAELEEELASRGNFQDGYKDDLQEMLDETLTGKQRVPALLFKNPESSLQSLNLGQYEILPCEPLHDIGHHIQNVLTELPYHVSDAESQVINECIDITLGNKESKRTIDYRSALVKTAAMAHQSNIISTEVLSLLDTLIQMQEILYSPDDKRSPALVLRYLNQAWYHSILLKRVIKKPKKLTMRKLFGVYYHNLTTHAGLMLRLISGLASNTEEQERIFNAIKRITKQTSNYHPGQIIPNLLVRLQAENELGLHDDDVGRQQSQISKLAKSLPPATNSCFPKTIIIKYSREWQAHLQQISDFLLEKEGVWWSQNDDTVLFNDVTNYPPAMEAGPQLHHYRSSSLEREASILETSWNECINKKIVVPAKTIRVDKEDGTTIRLDINFSNIYNPDEPLLPTNIPMDDHQKQDELDDEGVTAEEDIVEEEEEEEQEQDNEEQEDVLDIYPTQEEIISTDDNINLPSAANETNNNCLSDSVSNQANHTSSNESHETTTSQHTDQNNEMSDLIQPNVKTSIGKALVVILGQTEEVQCLDSLHYKLKQMSKQKNPKRDRHLEQRYEENLANIQVKVLKSKSATEKKLKVWEKKYVMDHGLKSPSLEDMQKNTESSVLLKKIKYAKAMLTNWKIDL